MELKPGYKQTEAGVIPEDWIARRLGDLTSVVGSGRSKVSAEQGTYPVHGSTGVIGYSERPDYEGDAILVARVGANAGKLNIVAGRYGVTDNTIIVRMRAHAHLSFFLRQLESKRLNNLVFGSGQPLITGTQLKNLTLGAPQLQEQRAIDMALSDVDALISSLDRLIAKKRDIKQATMQRLLTGKQRLPGFNGDWEVRRLSDVADVDPENLGSQTSSTYCFKYISLEDVDRGTLRGCTDQVFRTSPSRARRVLRKGDILVSTVRPNLRSHLLIRESIADLVCSTGFAVVRCKPASADPAYVYFHLFAGGIERQIESLLTGSNYPAINGRDVRALEIPLPSVKEQSAIAGVLSNMDAELAALDKKRDKTRALKQGMMQELLTGRIRLV